MQLPEPPAWLRDLPVIGMTLDDQWREAMVDLPASLQQLQPYIGTAAGYGLSFGAGLGFAVIEFLVAIVIAGILLVTGESARAGAAPLRRPRRRRRTIWACSTSPPRPSAALPPASSSPPSSRPCCWCSAWSSSARRGPCCWASSPSSFWSSSCPTGWSGCRWWSGSATRATTGYAIFLFVWGTFVVSTVDNFIRPYLISQGAKLPLLLIFVGVIGGLLAYGFIGLFVGATLLGVGYTLFRSWLDEDPPPPRGLRSEPVGLVGSGRRARAASIGMAGR